MNPAAQYVITHSFWRHNYDGADIVVVAPEAVGDDILGGWIHNGCGELIIV
jgi:hypothetical protein